MGTKPTDDRQNDLAAMLRECITDVVNGQGATDVWTGSKVKGVFGNDSITIDSICLIADNLPQELKYDSVAGAKLFFVQSVYDDYGKTDDYGTKMLTGLFLRAQCNITGRLCQIDIDKLIAGREINGISPQSYSISLIINSLKRYSFIYEYDCTSGRWRRLNTDNSKWHDSYDQNIINIAVYNSVMDFISRLKNIPGISGRTMVVITDDAPVSDPFRGSDLWYKLMDCLESQYTTVH